MSTTTQSWEKRFDEMFPCRHHASQCDGDCNDKIKDFIRRELEDGKVRILNGHPTPEMITEAGKQGAILQNLKLVLWDLVIASRVNKEAPIDVMPYVERIRNIFERK